ncbi:MAG: ribosome biogenesis factor YjgA [Thiotrichales bacterium]
MINDDESEFVPESDERPSKSALKRAAKAKRELADRLVELSPHRLARLALTPELAAIVAETRAIRAHGARRRQLQYLAKQLRRSGLAEGIEATLDHLIEHNTPPPAPAPPPTATPPELNTEDEAGIEAFLATHPGADRGRLRQLLRNAEHPLPERAARGRRALLAYLKELEADNR